MKFVWPDWEARTLNRLARLGHRELLDPMIEHRAEVVEAVASDFGDTIGDGLGEGDSPRTAKRLVVFLLSHEVGLSRHVIADETIQVAQVLLCPAELPNEGRVSHAP